MPKLLTQGVSSEPKTGRQLIGIVAGFKSERWPVIDRNAGRLQLGIRSETIYNPWHYVPVLTRKPGALRNGAPFHDWVLPAAMEKVRRRLKSMHDGDRQMVSILECVGLDGLPAVEAACQEALDQGVFSAAVIINILARKRDPQPAAILSIPDALRLTHEPLADCARYDSLRRAS